MASTLTELLSTDLLAIACPVLIMLVFASGVLWSLLRPENFRVVEIETKPEAETAASLWRPEWALTTLSDIDDDEEDL